MDALPPDPYAALGVAKDATAAAIKAQYRKLVLKHHPDKIQDEALKQSAADEFHKIQTAYEIVGDDVRRQRYDAQCRLVELRREMERESAERGYASMRSSFREPPESPRKGDFYARTAHRSGRTSPRFEERRPAYTEYFDSPRPTSRKDESYEPPKRSSRREDPKKSKTSSRTTKETERSSRAEKTKRSDKDVRREREQKKFAFTTVEDEPSSDSDPYERTQRRMREEDERQRARAVAEEARRRDEEEAAAAAFFGNDRARRMWDPDHNADYKAKENLAREYMAARKVPTFERRPSGPIGYSTQERGEFERRPSAPVSTSYQEREAFERRPSAPVASPRDKIETIKREGKPLIEVRRGSGRPTLATRDSSRKKSSREKDIHIVDEPVSEPRRRAPGLNKTHSSPDNIRPPFERQRSNSLERERRAPPPPSMKRSETMPYPSSKSEARRREPSARNSYPTPEATPEPSPLSPLRTASYNYTSQDEVVASPETYQAPYQTITREPSPKQRITRSPSPIREPREKSRGSALKHEATQPPSNKRMTSRSYSYAETYDNPEPFARPPLSRENSGRLFAEISTTQNQRTPSSKLYSPPADEIRYSPKARPEDVRTASGNYTMKRSNERPYSRNGQPISVR